MAAVHFGPKKSNYIVNTLLILSLFGPILSYFIILGDIAHATFPSNNHRLVKCLTILVSSAIVFYFCLQKNLAQISITSVLVLVSMFVFIGVLHYKYMSEPMAEGTFTYPQASMELFASIPAAYMALNCHNNFF
jgi:amino acid permease